MKSSIAEVVARSAEEALQTCDGDWNCEAGWTASSRAEYPGFRSTHLVAAALVAATGITE